MDTQQDQWSFISVFYEREQWHLLLEALREEIFENGIDDKGSINAFVFLSMHRGANIRLALNYSKASEREINTITKSVETFLRENPAREKELDLPINSLFKNFPTNQFHYNLFNQHALMQDGLIVYQDILSKILLQFFDDHPVDEDGLFTLMIYLLEALLDGMCTNSVIKKRCCLQLMRVIQDNEFNLPAIEGYENVPLRHMRKCSLSRLGDLSVHLKNLESASEILNRIAGDLIKSHITIMKIIQLQLFNVPGKLIFDSLCHIYHSTKNEFDGPKENVISDSFILNNI